jgi:hypothetical protein
MRWMMAFERKEDVFEVKEGPLFGINFSRVRGRMGEPGAISLGQNTRLRAGYLL